MATLLLLLAVTPPRWQATALAPPVDYSCDYLEAHRSLVCYCVRYFCSHSCSFHIFAIFRYRMVVTSLASLFPASQGPVESLVLQGCQSVSLKNTSTAHLTHPLYQMRVEEVDKVEIEGLVVGPAGLDLSVRGSREGVWLRGPLVGPRNTSLRFSITDCGQLQMVTAKVVGLRLLLRTSAVTRIDVVDLSLDLLERNSVEMGESKEIRLEGWRVDNVEEGALVVARVAKLEVVDSPRLDFSSFQLLDNITEVEFLPHPSFTAPLSNSAKLITPLAFGTCLLILGSVLLLMWRRRRRRRLSGESGEGGSREGLKRKEDGETDML